MNPNSIKHLSSSYKAIQTIVDCIRQKTNAKPTVGIICGSGLGKLADGVQNPQVLKYDEIENFPTVSVAGHVGNLVFGELGGKTVMVMQGRFHFYEGYSRHEIIIPIRVMKLMGVETLLVSNASGGLNPTYDLGDLMIIKDHISLPGLGLNNILVGPNDEEFGTRFVATSDAYDSELRKTFKQIAKQAGNSKMIREGVYIHVGGPTYESPAECRMLRTLGADVVGMSTAPEVVVARHAGMRVFAISLVTNIAVLSEESKEKANHEEVLQMANKRTEILQKLFTQLISTL